jgi:hypothetical protein
LFGVQLTLEREPEQQRAEVRLATHFYLFCLSHAKAMKKSSAVYLEPSSRVAREARVATFTLIVAAVLCLAAASTAAYLAYHSRPVAAQSLLQPQVVVVPENDLTEALPAGVVIGEVQASDGTAEVQVSFAEEPDGKAKVTKQRSALDNKYYLVAATLPERERAADTLAELSRRSQHLVHAVQERLDTGRPVLAPDGQDVTANMRRLVDKHAGKEMQIAEYHNPSDKTVGSNADKGVLIETCLRSKYDTSQWNSINTLTRVHVHELAHSADFHFRQDGEEAHGPDFYRLMNTLLKIAEQEGLYNCAEYTASNGAFCGLRLTENEVECG